jgi:hypothetical protein
MVLRLRVALVAVVLAACAVLALVLRPIADDDEPVPVIPTPPGAQQGSEVGDPFAWTPERSADLSRRAAEGTAHLLYTRSPGGVAVTAERVAGFRAPVERAAKAAGVDPDRLQALVFLESAGRPDAAADPRLDGAVGLTQILAETGRNLLGMTVDPAGARRIGRSIRRNEGRGRDAVVARLKARRRAIDQRFDPVASLRATARYLTLAKRELGGDDLAVVSYHMGMGNLQGVLRDYGDDEVPYAQLFFDSTPLHHPAAWSRLASFGDDSSTYLWRVEAARDIMRRWREDPAALERLDVRQTAKASAEEVLHPRSSTEIFKTPGDVEDAEDDGDLVALPVRRLADAGITIGPGMGELAGRLDQERSRYRALRPEALAMLEYLGAGTQAISGTGPLIVTSTVRDTRYQRVLASENIEATHAYSLHTTGYTFDIERDYASGRQARAFQFLLDRLTALDLIAWVREPAAIHITVSARAGDALRR